mmetsp:Transcript_38839/g.62222  ORF Transcript_38839/g.62222 Transcript_38839/m.62222 type:complete len:205 (+) Transcript_38839:523-1137(+)
MARQRQDQQKAYRTGQLRPRQRGCVDARRGQRAAQGTPRKTSECYPTHGTSLSYLHGWKDIQWRAVTDDTHRGYIAYTPHRVCDAPHQSCDVHGVLCGVLCRGGHVPKHLGRAAADERRRGGHCREGGCFVRVGDGRAQHEERGKGHAQHAERVRKVATVRCKAIEHASGGALVVDTQKRNEELGTRRSCVLMRKMIGSDDRVL